jgi:uncharacterized metal-binding protein YceD (DUF177 family)
MSKPTSEFARLVPLTRVASEPFRQRIAADEAERAALARRFDLVSLDRLEADIELLREPSGTILLSATFEAVFAQECVVTFDPIAGNISERFQLRYGPPDIEINVPTGDDDPAFEPLDAEAIDIGEAVAQEFSLALPSFPRADNAEVETEIEADQSAGNGPFAALARLSRREPQ